MKSIYLNYLNGRIESLMNTNVWEFFVDTGGTFTDCLARSKDGDFIRAKVLSKGNLSSKLESFVSAKEIKLESNVDWPNGFVNDFLISFAEKPKMRFPIKNWNLENRLLSLGKRVPFKVSSGMPVEIHTPWVAPILGMRLILARQGLDCKDLKVRMRLATTRCTNALLENSGESPVLFITSGFADLLKIGDQRRNNLFSLIPEKRVPLCEEVVEIKERVDRHGVILQKPDLNEIEKKARKVFKAGYRSAAVSLLHSYLNPTHEQKIADLLREIGFERVVESARLSPLIKWRSRCESAVVEAYLSSTLDKYLNRVESGLGENGELLVNSSSGGLINRSQYRAVDSLLSGPAGGVVGASSISKRCGFARSINLDMGGTSADVSRFSGTFDYQMSHRVGEAEISNIALKLETVAAGGGSICWVENGLLKVGPKSSGAYPGPACYGFGGPLCLTDINLLLGRLDPSRFSVPLIKDDAEKKLLEIENITGRSSIELLHGFLAIADDAMANAIRKISIEEGYDPSEHALVAFGGAGGQHACGVASRLGMKTILSPADAGLLSAYGLAQSRVERILVRSVLGPMDCGVLNSLEMEMEREGMALIRQMGEVGEILEKTALVRFVGQEVNLEVGYEKSADILALFQKKFRKIFGYLPEGNKLEIHSLRIRIGGALPNEIIEDFGKDKNCLNVLSNSVLRRDDLNCGDELMGPCLLVDRYGTFWIENGWSGRMGTNGTLLLESNMDEQRIKITQSVKRELFSSRFHCLAEEMGKQLERTAFSVNIRERLDFSCALLDGQGFLVVNAPHIPVHLGALGLFARRLIQEFSDLSEGDILISNHPGYGGSHLPDVSLLAPVFSKNSELIGFVANRAHHAEIGGVVPGSMPGSVGKLVEEGVVIPPSYLFRKGKSQMSQIENILNSGPFPTRQLKENLSDLLAQIASLRMGCESLNKLISTHGSKEIMDQMSNLREESSSSCREFLKKFGTEDLSGIQYLDDGTKLQLRVKMRKGSAEFDFSGTDSVRSDNLNATEAIVSSVVCYCLRILIGKDLPLNEGLLEPIELIVPSGSLLHPNFHLDESSQPGVAGGNVELSQRLTDLILSSVFKVAACSQGTMNNLSFGNDHFSHYETLGGGAGACVGCKGTSAVQVHMTNTAITDPEIMESRFPVQLLSHRIRKGSGGSGTWYGGDGVEREYEFQEKTTFSFLTQRRKLGPEGLEGGSAGLPGEQILFQKGGEKIKLPGSCTAIANPGDRLIVRTPGGGGVGGQTN